MIADEIVIGLKKPVSIATSGGEYLEFGVLTVNLPTISKYKAYSDVVSVVSRAVFKMKGEVNNKSAETIPKEEKELEKKTKNNPLPLVIFAGADELENLQKVINTYMIACCKFDEVNVTQSIINKLSLGDYNKILSEISGFLFKGISETMGE